MSLKRTALLLLSASAGLAPALAADDLFSSKIEPLLQKNCFECHSHTGKMKGGLTLDSKSGWEVGGNSGAAIAPGRPQDSLLIKAVSYADKDLQMPPKHKLSEADIELLKEWITRGAPDPRENVIARNNPTGWWALKPLVRTSPQKGESSYGNPIDSFVAAKLREKGLAFSPAAQPQSLVRRLYFDLHGLPPTPEEVESFVSESRRDRQAAEAALVDRLLASPRYGERMARLWLDLAHYGESDGFGMDRPRPTAWPYRDYVIEAFNSDRSYPRFVQEQIAADYLFPENPKAIAALGFLAAGPFNQSALVEQVDGTDCKKIALNLDRDDMVSTVAGTFLSVTVHCARCHEHKFDPISQRDYYRLQACFAGLVRGNRDYDSTESMHHERSHWQTVRKQLESGESWSALAEEDQKELTAQMPELKRRLLNAESQWQAADLEISTECANTKIVHLPDQSLRFEGEAADKDTYTLTLSTPLPSISALRLEVLSDPNLPHGGPGRNASNGNLHLNEITVQVAPLDDPQKLEDRKLKQAVADFDQDGWDVKKAIDGNSATAWGIHPMEGRSHAAVFAFSKPISHPRGSKLVVRLAQVHGQAHLIGRLRVSLTGEKDPAAQSPPSPDLLALLKAEPAHKTAEDSTRLLGLAASLLASERLSALPPARSVFAVGSDIPAKRNYKPPKEPYPIRILRRGDINRPGAEVRPGALECVSTLQPTFALANAKDEASRRGALAQWISDPANPLAWRSIANRLWQWHFGRGLVETPNDFGKMGAVPSHPELLDWLACQIRDGASLKQVQRWILTSRTYQQESYDEGVEVRDHTPLEKDADNRWLWRQNRQRMDAEQLRDAVLAISGTLDDSMGGASVMQFNYSDPNPNVVPRIDYEGFDPDAPANFRRGVYRYLFRNANDSLLDAFDSANPSLSTPRRNSTITPLQALSLFNHAFLLRQSQHLAERLSRESSTVETQIDRAFVLLYSRPPAEDERDAVAAYVRQHGLANACRVLFNSNEFLFIP